MKGLGNTVFEEKWAMANAHKALVEAYGTPITRDQYNELREYADSYGIRLSGFRNFVGDIEVIKTIIDDINIIAEDFPKIIDERAGIVLQLDYEMSGEDYATTDSGHVVRLNAAYFSNIEKLRESYAEGEKSGHFVRNTEWRSVVRHEMGHVVENFYCFDIVKITESILGIDNRLDILAILRNKLSIYSSEYYDCREVISESFSGYYSSAENDFADNFVKRCISDAMDLR